MSWGRRQTKMTRLQGRKVYLKGALDSGSADLGRPSARPVGKSCNSVTR
jgi:hypothetical protein